MESCYSTAPFKPASSFRSDSNSSDRSSLATRSLNLSCIDDASDYWSQFSDLEDLFDRTLDTIDLQQQNDHVEKEMRKKLFDKLTIPDRSPAGTNEFFRNLRSFEVPVFSCSRGITCSKPSSCHMAEKQIDATNQAAKSPGPSRPKASNPKRWTYCKDRIKCKANLSDNDHQSGQAKLEVERKGRTRHLMSNRDGIYDIPKGRLASDCEWIQQASNHACSRKDISNSAYSRKEFAQLSAMPCEGDQISSQRDFSQSGFRRIDSKVHDNFDNADDLIRYNDEKSLLSVSAIRRMLEDKLLKDPKVESGLVDRFEEEKMKRFTNNEHLPTKTYAKKTGLVHFDCDKNKTMIKRSTSLNRTSEKCLDRPEFVCRYVPNELRSSRSSKHKSEIPTKNLLQRSDSLNERKRCSDFRINDISKSHYASKSSSLVQLPEQANFDQRSKGKEQALTSKLRHQRENNYMNLFFYPKGTSRNELTSKHLESETGSIGKQVNSYQNKDVIIMEKRPSSSLTESIFQLDDIERELKSMTDQLLKSVKIEDQKTTSLSTIDHQMAGKCLVKANSCDSQPCFEKTSCSAVAKYNFIARNDGELSFNAGDRLEIDRKVDECWYIGRVRGRVGLVPFNYVCLGDKLLPSSAFTEATGPNYNEGSSGLNMNKHSASIDSLQMKKRAMVRFQDPLKTVVHRSDACHFDGTQDGDFLRTKTCVPSDPNEIYVGIAKYDFVPNEPEEIQFRENDIICINQICDNGWLMGTSLSSGQTGYLPGNYIRMIFD